MELNYEMLKNNVVKVELLIDLDLYDNCIPKGTIGSFNVQPYNGWYELTLENGESYDVALEDDELNNCIKGLKFIGLNKHFIKEEA